MKNNSRSNIEVKVQGTQRGADEMMKYDAVGSMILKILGGIALLVSSVAMVIYAIAPNGLI